MPKCVSLFKPSPGENIHQGIVFTWSQILLDIVFKRIQKQTGMIFHFLGAHYKVLHIWYRNICLHCSRIIWHYCLEFKSEQSGALSFSKLPIHSKMLYYFCLFSQLLSCFIIQSFHSLPSIPRCTRAIKWGFSTIWGQCRQLLSAVVTCVSDEWNESSSSTCAGSFCRVGQVIDDLTAA